MAGIFSKNTSFGLIQYKFIYYCEIFGFLGGHAGGEIKTDFAIHLFGDLKCKDHGADLKSTKKLDLTSLTIRLICMRLFHVDR